MPSKKSKRARKAAQEAKKKQLINIGIVIAIVLVVIWIALSGQKSAEEIAPEADDIVQLDSAPEVEIMQFDSAPAMTIDTNAEYFATVKMAKGGEFTIQLYPDKAPVTVNSFVFLARQGYFDGTTFHRVLQGFMAQGGDQSGTGRGGPGYQFVNEDSDLTFDRAGVVAMANAGRDTNGSQFFITFGPTPQLNGDYTIFGQVIEGMDVVNSITLRDPQYNPNFVGDVIESITIEER